MEDNVAKQKELMKLKKYELIQLILLLVEERDELHRAHHTLGEEYDALLEYKNELKERLRQIIDKHSL